MEKTLYINVTDECNLRCPHCFKTERNKRVISLSSVEDALADNPDVKHVVLFGGEFLLRKNTEYVLKLIDYVKKFDVEISGTTNLCYETLDCNQRLILDKLDCVSTSWNPDRFETPKQLQFWVDNLERIPFEKLSILITLTNSLLSFEPKTICDMFNGKASVVKFEPYIGIGASKPKNKDVDLWLKDFYLVEKFGNTTFEPFCQIEEGFKHRYSTGTFCRNCHRTTLNLKVDGGVTCCPNCENMPIEQFKRLVFNFNEACFPCEFFQFCKGNCPLLTFDETGCCGYPNLFKAIKERLTNGH